MTTILLIALATYLGIGAVVGVLAMFIGLYPHPALILFGMVLWPYWVRTYLGLRGQ